LEEAADRGAELTVCIGENLALRGAPERLREKVAGVRPRYPREQQATRSPQASDYDDAERGSEKECPRGGLCRSRKREEALPSDAARVASEPPCEVGDDDDRAEDDANQPRLCNQADAPGGRPAHAP